MQGLEPTSALLLSNSNRVGLELVVRDGEGAVMLAMARTFLQDWSVEHAEVAAILWALKVARQNEWGRVIVESDAQCIIRAINNLCQRRGDIQLIVEDVKQSSVEFDNISFAFCFRECNEIAYRLAKWATSSYCDEVWHDGDPTWISDLIVSDYPTIPS